MALPAVKPLFLYFRPYNDNDRICLRSLVAPPDYYNSQRTTLDLGSMRAISYDAKSLKCTLSTVSPSFKRSFFYRVHLLWNREESVPSKFKILVCAHLWDVLMKPD